ncbi:uncharacterized protein LOC111621062 [Centruroides sculpturatus]|uniref:uncharacterized protein LOC111621062 n=1 Tax=Centruroides sculpturatus TaxID=218467 RepID=UPI000C6C9C6B|nr:uncharacterized protein LOC111621062 [Centruroides sculpturatus]
MNINDIGKSIYQIIKTSSAQTLIKLLKSIDGSKHLILDDDLICTLDHIATMSELRKIGVERIFKLGPTALPVESQRCIYLVRFSVKSVTLIADHLKANADYLPIAYIVFVPRKVNILLLI